MKRYELFVFSGVFLLVIIGVCLAYFDYSTFEAFWVNEDGLIEWLTVVALFLSLVVSVIRLIKINTSRGILFFVIWALFALAFIFGVGEEISWGQRIICSKTPDFFVKYNSQGETNVHNLVVNGKKINKIVFGTGIGIVMAFYLLFIPIIYVKNQKIKKLCDYLGIPIPKIIHIVAFLFLVVLVSIPPASKNSELLEFGSCWIFLLLFISPKNSEIFDYPEKINLK